MTLPPDILVDRVLNPSKHPKNVSIRAMLTTAVKDGWIDALADNVVNQDYLAIDNSLNLKAVIDAIAEIEGVRYVCKFSYVSNPKLNSISEKGPLVKDVVSINMSCRMISCYDGLMFYQHGEKRKIFHICFDESLHDSIEKKCQRLRDFMLMGGVPKKSGRKNDK